MILNGMIVEMVEYNDWNDEVLSKYEFIIIFIIMWILLEIIFVYKN